MQSSRLAKRTWLLIFLAVIVFYLYGLGHLPLVGPDEPRYAQVAREMLLRSDLITPTLGGHTWFEKPALLYWMMIASYRLFGVSEWAARLGPAVSGLLTVVAVFWTGKRVCQSITTDQPRGLGPWSALVAASTLGIIVFSRGAGFDGVLTMTTTWALGFYLVGEVTHENQRRRLWIGFFFFIGLSLLAKGLIGLIAPAGIIVTYHLLRREFPSRAFLLSLVWGVPLSLAVAAIWYGPVIARHGWPFIDEFFIEHHFARYTTNKYHHPQPFFFYLLVIIPLSLPWTAFLIEGLVKIKSWRWKSDDAKDKLRVFSLAWLALPLAFFSMSSSKLPGYIVPVLPAIALIAGERIARFVSGGPDGIWSMRITGAMAAAFALGACLYANSMGTPSLSCAVMVAVPILVTAMLCLFWTRLRSVSSLSVGLAVFAALVIALNCGAAAVASRESTRDLLQAAEERGYGPAPVYALHEIDRTAEFYAAGRVVYNADGEPLRFESALEVLDAARKHGSRVLVLVPREYVYQLTSLPHGQVELIGNNGRMALVGVSGD